MPVWVPLSAALFGAVAAGIIQACLQARQRKLEARSVLVALVAEISSICFLIRELRYFEWVDELLKETMADTDRFYEAVVYLGSDYFSVFHGLVSKLGMLSETDAKDIVKFYGLCKLSADCADPSGIQYDASQRDGAVQNLQTLRRALCDLLALGDELVQRTNRK